MQPSIENDYELSIRLDESELKMLQHFAAQESAYERYPAIADAVVDAVRNGGEVTKPMVEAMFHAVGESDGGGPLTDKEVADLTYLLLDYLARTNQIHYEGSHWSVFDPTKHALFS